MNSRQKGAAGERELSHKLEEVFGIKCRRSQQFCGANGDSDVVGIPGLHIESKRVESLNIHKAVDQAVRDSEKTGGVPVVCHRKNRTEWLLTVRLDDVPRLVEVLKGITSEQA